MHSRKGKKVVWIDPEKQRVVTHEELLQLRQSHHQTGLELGFQQGYLAGKKKAMEQAFSDLAEVWQEVAKWSAASNAYARTIAGMHSAQVPKQNEAKESK